MDFIHLSIQASKIFDGSVTSVLENILDQINAEMHKSKTGKILIYCR